MGTAKLVLVTGASGYVASHVVLQLQQAGYRVRGTVRSLSNESRVESLRKLVPDAKHALELVEADLNSDRGWDNAARGCSAVVHVACPVPRLTGAPGQVLGSAVQGTLRVLRAAAAAGIKRVVLTGSFAAVHGHPVPVPGKTYTEEDRTDPDCPALDGYHKAKTLTENAAWNFANQLPDERKFELVVILPTCVVGPPLLATQANQSLDAMRMALSSANPGWPALHSPLCDVRDVARAHVKALRTPKAAGKRILVHAESRWSSEVAGMVAKEFRPQGYTVYTNTIPYLLLWIMSCFNKRMKEAFLVEKIGKTISVSNYLMVELLGIKPRSIKESVIDMAYAMIDLGMIPATRLYRKVGSRAHEQYEVLWRRSDISPV